MRGVSRVRSLYHRVVPESVRNPFGMARRHAQDRLTRLATPAPLPPASLLNNIQLTPFVSEYLHVGRRSAASITRALQRAGVPAGAAVLDFGCGSARTLRHINRAGWVLHGCDVDQEALEWARKALPRVEFRRNTAEPPLPWKDSFFSAAWAVSVFTHMAPDEQRSWLEELARVLEPGSPLILTTMGPSVIGNFTDHDTPANRTQLQREGIIFRSRTGAFNDQAAFHTPAGIRALTGELFALEEWIERGLDGFQDLSVLRRRD